MCQETEQDETWAPAELHGVMSKQHCSAGTELRRAQLAAATCTAAVRPLSTAVSCAETQAHRHKRSSTLCCPRAQTTCTRNKGKKCTCKFLSLTAPPQPASS